LVVALSAYCSDTRWRELALQVGCESCIAKPIDFAELSRILSAYFNEDLDSGFKNRQEKQNEKPVKENIGSHASILTDKEWKIGGKVLSVDDEVVALQTTDSEQILNVALSKVVCVYFQIR